MTFPLSSDEYQSIRILYKTTKDKNVATRLNIILLKHKNYAQIEIANILNIDANMVSTWVKKFEASITIAQYLTLNYTSYVGKLSYEFLGKLDDFIEDGAFSDAKPIISSVKDRFNVNYSVSGMTKLVKRLGFSYKQKVALPSKLDTKEQLDFVENYNEIERNLTDKCAIFFMDAVHPQHNTHTLKAWLRKGKTTYISTNSGRNRLNRAAFRVNGLYNPHNQNVIVTYHKTINAQATIELFEKLKEQNPDKTSIYVFADNAKYYVSSILKDYLAQNPVIKLIHLPTYSSNLNGSGQPSYRTTVEIHSKRGY